MDKFIGIMFLVVVVGAIAMASVVTYQIYATNQTTSDMYGQAFSAKTNASNTVGKSVAPSGISVTGFMIIPLVILGLICIAAVVFKAMGRGGSSGMR